MSASAFALLLSTALPPSEKWIVNFADAQCVASRSYGEGDGRFNFLIKPSPLGNVVQIALVRTGKRAFPDQIEATITVDGASPMQTNALVYGAKSQGKVVSMFNLSQENFRPIRQAGTISFAIKSTYEISIQLTQMKDVMATLDRCLDDLQQTWNVTEARAALLKSPATELKPLASIFSSDDYPATPLWNSQGGALRYVALIDEKGAVADCVVDQSSGFASLDAQSCFVIKTRGAFTPAIGRDGRPAKGTRTGVIRWQPGTGSSSVARIMDAHRDQAR